MNQLAKQLEGSGLSEKEAAVYVATLSLGIASIADIAKRADIKRPTAYLAIETLLQKQLLAQIPRGTKMHYKAESPEQLLAAAESKKETIAQSLPDLLTLFKQNSVAPKVRFYEGKQALLKLYEEAFRSREIWSVFSPKKYCEVFTLEDNKHLLRILDRQGGIIYDLAEDSPATRKLFNQSHRRGLSKDRILPKEFSISTDILVYGHCVALVSLETLVGVVIEDKSIAATQKMFIQNLWEKGAEI